MLKISLSFIFVIFCFPVRHHPAFLENPSGPREFIPSKFLIKEINTASKMLSK